MHIKFLASLFLFGMGTLQAHKLESIEIYDAARDHDFITQLVAQYPKEIPDAYLYPDLASEIVRATIPMEDGKSFMHAVFKQHIFVYCLDRLPVGYIRIFDVREIDKYPNLRETSIIAQLVVLPMHQQKGIAEKLARHAITDFKIRGVKLLVFDIIAGNRSSEKLCEKFGLAASNPAVTLEEKDDCWGRRIVYNVDLALLT
jgi:GNAT superfamily N-acetyltransferase